MALFFYERFQRGPLCDVFGIGGASQAVGSVASAGIGAAATIAAANKQTEAAKYASDRVYQAASDSNQLQRQVFDTTQANQAPFIQSGQSNLQVLNQGLNDGTYNATFGGQFTAPTASTANPNTGNQYATTSLNPTFSFDASDLENDPGYQFQLKAGQNSLMAQQAAGGVAGGAAAKELARYNQDYAGTAYNTAYARAQNTFQQNFSDTLGQNQQNFGNLNTVAQQTFANTESQTQGNFNRDLQKYDTGYAQWENDQNTNFNRRASLAGVGQTATAQLASTGSQYATSAGNTITGAAAAGGSYATQGANAAAAGYVQLGNNIGSTVQSLGGLVSNPGGSSRVMIPYTPTYPVDPKTGL